MGNETLNKETLENVRDTLFVLEPEDGWIKVSEKELLDGLKNKEFDEIIVSRDIIECNRKDKTLLSICKKGEDFYVRDERDEENRVMDFKKLIEEL